MNDLIERLQKTHRYLWTKANELATTGKLKRRLFAMSKDCTDAIAALSTPLPEEVEKYAEALRKTARDSAASAQYIPGDTRTCCTDWPEWQAADILERLARENAELQGFKRMCLMPGQERTLRLMDAEEEITRLEKRCKECDRALERIESYAEDVKHPNVNHHEIGQHIVDMAQSERERIRNG